MVTYLSNVIHHLRESPERSSDRRAMTRELLQRRKGKEVNTTEGVAVFAKWAPATGLFHRRYSGLDVFGEGEDNGVQE